MAKVMPEYEAAVGEAVNGILALAAETHLKGAMLATRVMRGGAGFDTMGGEYRVTSHNWSGRPNATRLFTNLAAALTARENLSAAHKQLWHIDTAGHRHLVVKD